MYNETVHQQVINFRQDYVSFRRKILYNIIVVFGVPTKLFSFIKMCLNETYEEVRVGECLCLIRFQFKMV
jgi:hypothetical protein